MVNTFTEYLIQREIKREVHENEIFIYFNSDYQAEAFQDWLYSAGMMAFGEWLEAHKEDYE